MAEGKRKRGSKDDAWFSASNTWLAVSIKQLHFEVLKMEIYQILFQGIILVNVPLLVSSLKLRKEIGE